jgi:hypothetical protein
MNEPSVRRWSHSHMSKAMGLLFVFVGLSVLAFFGIHDGGHASCGVTLGAFFLAGGGVLCLV